MKTTSKLTALLMSVVLALGVFASCKHEVGTGGGSIPTYTISYETEYGEAPESQTVKKDTVLDESYFPTLEENGCTFLYWYVLENEEEKQINIEEGYVVTADVTFHAKWQLDGYIVTYESEYGTVPKSFPVTKNQQLDAEYFPKLTAKACTFMYWYVKGTDQIIDAEEGYKVTGNVTFVAEWHIDGYTVSYVTDYGTAPEAKLAEPKEILDESYFPELEVENLIFKGWKLGSGSTVEPGYEITSDITLYAIWETPGYSVTYKTDEYTNFKVITVAPDTVLDETYLVAPDVTKAGYKFIGWYYNYEKAEPGTITVGEAGVTLIAKWELIEYTISFESELGTNGEDIDDQTCHYGDKISLPDLYEDTWVLDGWYIGDTKIDSNYEVTKDVTLTAKWSRVKCTITYDTYYGKKPESVEVDYDTVIGEDLLPELTEDNCTFKRWYLTVWNNETGWESINAKGYIVKDNITLEAEWETASYAVIYINELGDAPESFVAKEGDVLDETKFPALEKEGYIFKGWYNAYYNQLIEPGTNPHYTVYESGYTFVARWQRITYKITYSSEFGTTPGSKTVDWGTELTEEELPVLEEAGHTFKGWKLNTTAATEVKVGTEVYENLALVAVWEVQKVTINYTTSKGTAPEKATFDWGTTLIAEDLPVLEVKDWTFLGWFNGDTEIKAGYKVKENLYLVAKWKVRTYKITYVSEYGEVPASFELDMGETLSAAKLPELTAENCTFEGWYIGDTDQKATAGYEVKDDLVLKAKWTVAEDAFIVSFKSDYGTAPVSITKKAGEKITISSLPTLYDANGEYNFTGWYLDGEKLTGEYTVTKNVTFTAGWEHKKGWGGINISIEPIYDSDISLTYSVDNESNIYTFTATEGYVDYIWKIDGEVQEETTNMFDFPKSLPYGRYVITVYAKDRKGNLYSGSYSILIQ